MRGWRSGEAVVSYTQPASVMICKPLSDMMLYMYGAWGFSLRTWTFIYANCNTYGCVHEACNRASGVSSRSFEKESVIIQILALNNVTLYVVDDDDVDDVVSPIINLTEEST